MTKMMTLRFLGRKQEMTHPAPRGERGDPHKVPREAVVTILPEEMTTIAGIVMGSFIAAVDAAATTLLHQEEGDLEEMSCEVQGQGQTPQFQGASRDLELHQDTQSTDVTALVIMIELRTCLIEPETLTPSGGTARGTPRMMLKQHHQRPPQGQIVDVREIIPRHQLRLLLAREVL